MNSPTTATVTVSVFFSFLLDVRLLSSLFFFILVCLLSFLCPLFLFNSIRRARRCCSLSSLNSFSSDLQTVEFEYSPARSYISRERIRLDRLLPFVLLFFSLWRLLCAVFLVSLFLFPFFKKKLLFLAVLSAVFLTEPNEGLHGDFRPCWFHQLR